MRLLAHRRLRPAEAVASAAVCTLEVGDRDIAGAPLHTAGMNAKSHLFSSRLVHPLAFRPHCLMRREIDLRGAQLHAPASVQQLLQLCRARYSCIREAASNRSEIGSHLRRDSERTVGGPRQICSHAQPVGRRHIPTRPPQSTGAAAAAATAPSRSATATQNHIKFPL